MIIDTGRRRLLSSLAILPLAGMPITARAADADWLDRLRSLLAERVPEPRDSLADFGAERQGHLASWAIRAVQHYELERSQ
jgi:hypothetical protein